MKMAARKKKTAKKAIAKKRKTTVKKKVARKKTAKKKVRKGDDPLRIDIPFGDNQRIRIEARTIEFSDSRRTSLDIRQDFLPPEGSAYRPNLPDGWCATRKGLSIASPEVAAKLFAEINRKGAAIIKQLGKKLLDAE